MSKEVEKTVFHDGGVVDTSVSVLKLLAVLQIICALYSAYRYRKNYLKYDHYDNYVMEVISQFETEWLTVVILDVYRLRVFPL